MSIKKLLVGSCGVMFLVAGSVQASVGAPLGYHELTPNELSLILSQGQNSSPVVTLLEAAKQKEELKVLKVIMQAEVRKEQARLKMQQAKKSLQFHGYSNRHGRP